MLHNRTSKCILALAGGILLLGGPIMAQEPPPPESSPGAVDFNDTTELERPPAAGCERRIFADVVALDQVFFWNRLGAVEPQGMIYALRRDIVSTDSAITDHSRFRPGEVELREDKRPRPLVLRMNVGDCMTVRFQNLLNPTRVDNEQPFTRTASMHAPGLQYVRSIADAGFDVGRNAFGGVVRPGQTTFYTWYAEREGSALIYSGGAVVGGQGDGGSISAGLFGAIVVEPRSSEWYRSQVTRRDLEAATVSDAEALSPAGHPRIDYDAVYQSGPFQGLPILRILRGADPSSVDVVRRFREIVHSDLTAIITGPGRGDFPPGTYPPNPVYPNRNRAFREFTIIFHDEIGAVQAFPEFFDDDVLHHTTHSGRDAFAINYGTGGIGAEIYANRIGVGPMRDCVECKYEEFFLSSWAVGDPAMVVDVPANATCPSNPTAGCPERATKALYPDDPSNVYHSYLNDHLKFRNLLAGTDDHHIFHLHAHQWLHTPDSDKSAYLDSQAIGQGTSFTYEITYGGSGNRNRTPGDSIFHCHFYPHFAQGMWSLWRVHDVFERGTRLDENGRPAQGSRALPDGEILAGTPIPAIVPIPGQPMAPMPGARVEIVNGQPQVTPIVQTAGTASLPGASTSDPSLGNPGYPFYIPGVAGHRPPHPPLDTIHDGGLPRHLIIDGDAFEVHTRLDFTKELERAVAFRLPEAGTAVEDAAMTFHEQSGITTPRSGGGSGAFRLNGLRRAPGAPYADPCFDEDSEPIGQRTYKAADIEMDVIFNKKGWHFPQQRFIALNQDVDEFLNQGKPPEPLFFRANTRDCITYELTNLVPHIYELDDFQVRTPTDILGQHIHLVKFDVTSSDGSANGFNYEDGTFSPGEVQERIHAINEAGGLFACQFCRAQEVLTLEQHPFFPPGPDKNRDGTPDWLGAQTTVQRWYADKTLDLDGNDRTLRTVFTHDHFGPSTHQQAGLYAGLVIEPHSSQWFHNETGAPFYVRDDGGPTSWQAKIETPNPADGYREFLFEFADFQLAYEPNDKQPQLPYDLTPRQPGEGFDDPANAINPPGRKQIGLPFLYQKPDRCPTLNDENGGIIAQNVPPPCPELVSADDPGTFSVNYRNEPVGLRVRDPVTNTQAAGLAGDLSFVYSSQVNRADPALNVQPSFYREPLTGDMGPRDPYTPVLRVFEGDDVQIRVLVGAHEEEHNFSVHGVKWLFEPSDPNSGYRNSQMMGISEHFEFEIPALPASPTTRFSDFLWKASAAADGQWNGIWGIVRAYRGRVGNDRAQDLTPLNKNPQGRAPAELTPSQAFSGICPSGAPLRTYDVVAITAAQLPDRTLIYNRRSDTVNDEEAGLEARGPLHDPTGILYVHASDYDFNLRQLRPRVPVEPLILRARAGECIQVSLRNELPAVAPDRDGFNAFPHIIEQFNANQVRPSSEVGLHPQLVLYDPADSDGANVGHNPSSTVPPGQQITYRWYAGDLVPGPGGQPVGRPIEFGSINLMPSDPVKHTNKGAVGALIIEPQGATWTTDFPAPQSGADAIDLARRPTRAAARVCPPQQACFREFVLIFQNDINLYFENDEPVQPLPENADPGERGQKAINYRTEPLWFRLGYFPQNPPDQIDYTGVLLNSTVNAEPETPIFYADAGTPVRFRVLHPGGANQNGAFEIQGHIWEEEPYTNDSTRLGSNPLSEWKGVQHGHGPTNHFDVLIKNGAGGKFRVKGDYLFRDYVAWLFHNGTWGIFRVK